MAPWSWITDPSGYVEVDRHDGAGFVRPKFPADTPQIHRALEWLPLAEKYGAKYGVPPAWILATITVESGGNPTAENFCCVGLMAIYVKGSRPAHPSKTREQMLDPEQNLDYGTSLLAKSVARGLDFPQTASVHNCGPSSINRGMPKARDTSPFGMCEETPYIERGVKALNTILDELGARPGNGVEPPPPLPVKTAGVGGTLLVFGAGAVVGYYAIEFLSGGLRRMK